MLSKVADALCEQGHAADGATRRGEFDEARTGYKTMLAQLDPEANSLQAYLTAKAVLGLLLCEVRAGELTRAGQVWVNHPVGLLERGFATAHDRCLYLMLSAYLTAVTASDADLASEDICHLMARARDLQPDADLRARTALNWRCHLEQLWKGQVPGRWLKLLDTAPAPGNTIAFLHPDVWHLRGLPRRVDPAGDFPALPPQVHAPPQMGTHSALWPWAWIVSGAMLGPLVAGSPDLRWSIVGMICGVVVSVPSWLLDYTLRRRQFLGVGAGALAALVSPWLWHFRLGWLIPLTIWWYSCMGAGAEMAVRKAVGFRGKVPDLSGILELMRGQNWEDAIAGLDLALQKNPRDWRLFANRAVCKARLGQFEEAESDYEEACQILGPTAPTRLAAVYGYRLWCEARLGNEDALQRAVTELTADDVEVVRIRVACQVLAHNWDAAEQVLEGGLRRHPASAALRLDRARLHQAHGRTDQAVADYLRVIGLANDELHMRRARAALLAIGADPDDPSMIAPPDPQVFVAADASYSLWFPSRPRPHEHGLILTNGDTHYLLEHSDETALEGLRLPRSAELRGELTWETAITDDGEVLSPEVWAEGSSAARRDGMRKYTRVFSAGGDELLTRRVELPEGIFQVSVWGPEGTLASAFQCLASLASGEQSRRPRYLFVPAQRMPGKILGAAVQGSVPWLAERRHLVGERESLLEVDSLEQLAKTQGKAYAPFHELLALQVIGSDDMLGIRPYQPLTAAAANELGRALRGGPAHGLVLLSAGLEAGSLRSLVQGLAGMALDSLGLFWCFGGDEVCCPMLLLEEIGEVVRALHCRRLTLLTALDAESRARLLTELARCPELRECQRWELRDDGYERQDVAEIEAVLQSNV